MLDPGVRVRGEVRVLGEDVLGRHELGDLDEPAALARAHVERVEGLGLLQLLDGEHCLAERRLAEVDDRQLERRTAVTARGRAGHGRAGADEVCGSAATLSILLRIASVERTRVSESSSRPAMPQSTPPQQDAAVVAAEAHRVRERDVDLDAARLVRHVVEVALRVGVPVVDRRRQHAVVERQRAHHRLDRAGRPEAVARHGLRRRDRELVGVVAEDLLQRPRLGEVAERRRGAVRVDVADALGRDPAASSAAPIIAATPVASGSGWARWCASFEAP